MNDILENMKLEVIITIEIRDPNKNGDQSSLHSDIDKATDSKPKKKSFLSKIMCCCTKKKSLDLKSHTRTQENLITTEHVKTPDVEVEHLNVPEAINLENLENLDTSNDLNVDVPPLKSPDFINHSDCEPADSHSDDQSIERESNSPSDDTNDLSDQPNMTSQMRNQLKLMMTISRKIMEIQKKKMRKT